MFKPEFAHLENKIIFYFNIFSENFSKYKVAPGLI